MWASVPEMFDCTEWDKISAISPLAAASSLQVIYKWGDFETKYTHNPVKTDPGTDIDTPSNSDDGATHTGCALEVASCTYAQNLLLMMGGSACTFTSVSYKKMFVGRTGGTFNPPVSKTLQWNQNTADILGGAVLGLCVWTDVWLHYWIMQVSEL